MILKVKSNTQNPAAKVRSMRLVEVIGQETHDGRDTHAVFEPDAFKDNETLCEGFFRERPLTGGWTGQMEHLINEMETIVLPNNLRLLLPGAFKDCRKLKEVQMLDSVKELGSGTFQNCYSLASINIPDGVKSIPDFCFAQCNSLESILIPDSVKEMGPLAFMGCSSLVNLDLPDGIQLIPDECFHSCRSLERINIPDSVKKLGPRAFFDCRKLNNIHLPEGIGYIPKECFQYCSSLEKIDIPSSLRNIGIRAFENCSSLVSVSLPDGIDAIPDGCFSGCTNLKQITIPSSVKKIGYSAFEGCSSLLNLYLPDRIEGISYQCFKGCTALEMIKIPSTVKEIGQSSFEDCSALDEIYVPDSVKFISQRTFKNCIKLVNLVIPEGVIELKDECFSGCTSLEQVCIPASVTYFGNDVFKNCSNIKRVHMPSIWKEETQNIFNTGCFPDQIDFYETDKYILDKGLLTTGDSRVLLRAFTNIQEEITLPSEIRMISRGAFEYIHDKIKKLVIRHPVELETYSLNGINLVQVLSTVFQANQFVDYSRSDCLEIVDKDWNITGRFSFDHLHQMYKHEFPKVTNLKEYDNFVFSEPLLGKKSKISVTINRLSFPFELEEESRQKYLTYLKANRSDAIAWLIEQNRFDELRRLADYLIIKSNVDKVLEIVNSKCNTELVAFLLDFKKKSLKIEDTKIELLDLIPKDPNSLREVQKLWKLSDLSAPELTLSGYKGSPQTSLTLPTIAGSKPITTIAAQCKIPAKEIIIPEGYKFISNRAFAWNDEIAKVSIADSVQAIGKEAFDSCGCLEEITLGERLVRIEEGTFKYCNKLEQVNIPETLAFIGPYSFCGCVELMKLELTENVTEIGKDAFTYCPKLVIHAPKGSYAIDYAKRHKVKRLQV